MINAQKEKLVSFFEGNSRFIIPFFQRPYVWDEENWETLWDNIKNIFDEEKNNNENEKEHFIGTLIIKQLKAKKLGDNGYELIDGQQRLTTISILLKTLADTCTGIGELKKLKNKFNELLIIEDARENKFLRLEHNRIDKPYFEAIMNNVDLETLNNKNHKLILSYDYFYNKVKDLKDNDREILKNIILLKIPIISMLLSENDDEQVIFDTINSLGVKLTTGELLKNYIFKNEAIRLLYDEYWRDVFESDEEQINFWNRDKTAGRIIRTNIEVLLYSYLIIEKLKEIKLERLFNEYKQWISIKNNDEIKSFLDEIKEYSAIYYNFPDGEELNEIAYNDDEKRFFQIIQGLQITTVYPLILYIYKVFPKKDENRMLFIKALESYLVRRNICRYTTKNYNKLFISILQSLKELKNNSNLSLDSFKNLLNSFNDPSNIFPSDSEIIKAFHNSYIPNYNTREILFCIALYEKKSGLNDVNKLSISSFSVEHIMPKKWEEHWSEPNFNEVQKLNRYHKLKTLGNLTLITKRLNSSLKNSSWDTKKDVLKQYSSLRMTTEYLEKTEWNESTIQERAEKLAKIAIEIWGK